MPEPKNSKNAYVCSMLHSTVTTNKDAGTTPMFIACPECNKRATSRLGDIDDSIPATHEWFKPSNDEMEAEAKKASEGSGISYHTMLSAFKEHVEKGGLILRKL